MTRRTGRQRRAKGPKCIAIDQLAVGDVLLFTEKSGGLFVSVKACRWISYTFAAFVVDLAPGTVQLCGHFAGPGSSHRRTGMLYLDELLRQSRFDAIHVRRLSHPLSEQQAEDVQRFAQNACRQDALAIGFLESAQSQSLDSRKSHRQHSSDANAVPEFAARTHSAVCEEEVVVLMAPPARAGVARFNCMPSAERFLTTRLIGDMLAAAGQVTVDGHTFVAQTDNDRVLAPAQELPPSEVARIRGYTPANERSTTGTLVEDER